MVFVSLQRLILAAVQYNHANYSSRGDCLTTHLHDVACAPNSSGLMTMPFPAETLLLEGADASAFAQAQFSSAVTSLAIGQWQFSAWLNPKGRVLALFHLARIADDRYLLLLRGGSATTMAEALQRFVFRSKVFISAQPLRGVATGPALPLGLVIVASPEETDFALAFGCDSHSLRATRPAAGDDDWRLQELRDGWPWLAPACIGEHLPPALSLQRLGAVAVDKGCYPGQEIVARMHFRAGHKRHLHHVILSQVMGAGDRLNKDEREAGCVLDVVNNDANVEALVILHDEVAAQANECGTLLLDQNIKVTLISTWPA
ncbi:folate-binding protein [Rhodanobacter sp. AS-Z3]|uniref:CAF17-like 4Fe-4S cluster assembly/insertion protein YgfZ n=1 Tax=Rhodanobacter sp. AS-Z3 TaxID=3031330 RepID=UPI00247AC9A4|nr:folate-binding protein [Rhodanobacter sp. AS-Z3]WEN14073.1 folate-binding protein [Rhodanobacter sp. AS-Z3]